VTAARLRMASRSAENRMLDISVIVFPPLSQPDLFPARSHRLDTFRGISGEVGEDTDFRQGEPLGVAAGVFARPC
jgi:hypothetical protein